jgi:hypothetical protein
MMAYAASDPDTPPAGRAGRPAHRSGGREALARGRNPGDSTPPDPRAEPVGMRARGRKGRVAGRSRLRHA